VRTVLSMILGAGVTGLTNFFILISYDSLPESSDS
jgi:hypothetical protein